MGVLGDIVTAKRAEVELLKTQLPMRLQRLDAVYTPRDIQLRRLPGDALRLIAELKFRSPSAGKLSTVLSVEQRAQVYHQAGAAMMSVLCDNRFFGGDYTHLSRARQSSDVPLLCKEFILDDVQLHYAAACGADWALLIVRCLTELELNHLVRACRQLGLTALVEVHRQNEVAQALRAGAEVIGVNARDLDTLQMCSDQATAVLRSLPESVTALHLSGIKTEHDVRTLAQTSTHGALVGEVLMRQDNPLPLLTSLVNAGTG